MHLREQDGLGYSEVAKDLQQLAVSDRVRHLLRDPLVPAQIPTAPAAQVPAEVAPVACSSAAKVPRTLLEAVELARLLNPRRVSVRRSTKTITCVPRAPTPTPPFRSPVSLCVGYHAVLASFMHLSLVTT